jgi:hypothetical protein
MCERLDPTLEAPAQEDRRDDGPLMVGARFGLGEAGIWIRRHR